MQQHSALWRHLKIYSFIVASIFSFQVLFQNLALAKEMDEINDLVRQGMGETMDFIHDTASSDLSNDEMWDRLLAKIGVKFAYAAADLRLRLHNLALETYEVAKKPARGICHSTLAWLLKKFGDLDDQQAEIAAKSGTWALEFLSDNCVQRKADELLLPDFREFASNLTWDGQTLMVHETAVTLPETGTTFHVEGTEAKLNIANLANQADYAKEVVTFTRDIHRTKVNSLQNMLLPNAYAAVHWGFVIAVALAAAVVLAIVAAIIIEFVIARQVASFYEDIATAADARIKAREEDNQEVQAKDLVDKLIKHYEDNPSYGFWIFAATAHELLDPYMDKDAEYVANLLIHHSWCFSIIKAAELARNEPDQLEDLLDYMQKIIDGKKSNEKRLYPIVRQAFNQAAADMVENSKDTEIITRANELRKVLEKENRSR